MKLSEIQSLVVLNAIPALSNTKIRKLVDHFGSAGSVLVQSESGLLRSGIIQPKAARNIIDFPRDKFLENEYNLVTKNSINIISYNECVYPVCLREIPDAPVVLYVRGELNPKQGLGIGIVGSRNASVYGLNVAEKFAAELAELGITVISGMARGIDAAAHRGALKARGVTFAVVGCGLSHIYPPENKQLFENIIASGGAVISEFPMTMPPLPYNFPRRNRIISGLSLGVIVIEAALKSGALITADLALEQGREVFAVPGRVDNPKAQGTHALIKQGAKLVHSLNDVLEELKPRLENFLKENRPENPPKESPQPVSGCLDDEEKRIFSLVSDRPVHIDALADESCIPLPRISEVLLKLELRQLIRQLPGKIFVKAGS